MPVLGQRGPGEPLPGGRPVAGAGGEAQERGTLAAVGAEGGLLRAAAVGEEGETPTSGEVVWRWRWHGLHAGLRRVVWYETGGLEGVGEEDEDFIDIFFDNTY